MARYMDIITDADRVMRNQEAYERLLKVRDEFIPTVVAASNLRVYSSVTHCDMKLGYSQVGMKTGPPVVSSDFKVKPTSLCKASSIFNV